MKKIDITKIFILPLLLGVGILTSCDSYLDEVPDNRLDTLVSLDQASELLVSGYTGATYNFVDEGSDNVGPSLTTDAIRWMTDIYSFKDATPEHQDTPTWFWNQTYNAIAHANKVLISLDGIDTKDIKRKNAIKGEALITRAYNHFLLANIFCQAYDVNTATSELGIPYVEKVEDVLKVTYKRGTLQETYDKIERDLLAGLPLISDEFLKGTGKYHFNKKAANAFASRFYLWKGDYEKCIEYSDVVLGKGLLDVTYCRNYKTVFKGSSMKEISDKFVSPNLLSNLLLVRKDTYQIVSNFNGYPTTKDIAEKIFQDNIQKTKDFRDAGWGYKDIYATPKFSPLKKYNTPTSWYSYFIMPVLRAEEVILNRMEAYVRTGKIAEALADYNVYAPMRYESGGQLQIDNIVSFYKGSEEEAMLALVIDERRKEFLKEGLRWWDIKRLKLSVSHKDIQGNIFELNTDDLKKAIQIPAQAQANGIEANPR